VAKATGTTMRRWNFPRLWTFRRRVSTRETTKAVLESVALAKASSMLLTKNLNLLSLWIYPASTIIMA